MTVLSDTERRARAGAAVRRLLLFALPGFALMIVGELFMAQARKAGHGPATWQIVCVGLGFVLNLVVVLRFRNTMRAIGLGPARRSRLV